LCCGPAWSPRRQSAAVPANRQVWLISTVGVGVAPCGTWVTCPGYGPLGRRDGRTRPDWAARVDGAARTAVGPGRGGRAVVAGVPVGAG
jgi:hypothetical protein